MPLISTQLLLPQNWNKSNSWAGHGQPKAKTEFEEEESDLEQQCDKPQRKPRNYNGWLENEVHETWTTRQDATLERAYMKLYRELDFAVHDQSNDH